MVTIIFGPQGSGKTMLANEAVDIAKLRNSPVPLVVDADDHFFYNPTNSWIYTITAANMIGVPVIICVQTNPDKRHGLPTIPRWLESKNLNIVSMGRINNYYNKPIPGTDNNV